MLILDGDDLSRGLEKTRADDERDECEWMRCLGHELFEHLIALRDILSRVRMRDVLRMGVRLG